MCALHRLATLPILCLAATAQSTPPDLLVTSRQTDQVLRYDGVTGSFLGVFAEGGGLDNPVGLTFGPDGALYVASGDTNQVLRYDGKTGAFVDVFAEGGGLTGPRNLNFGPDGALYVSSGSTNEILRFDGATGAFIDVFASGGNLQGPTSFTFGPYGDLFVVSVNNDRVKRYAADTGEYLGNFVTTNVDGPHDVAFGPDGRFYVVSVNQIRVRVFDPQTGTFQGTYVRDPALTFPLGMQWDGVGHFYVANQGADEVRRYDATTGELDQVIVTAGAGGLDAPLFLTFVPQADEPRLEPVFPGIAGRTNYLRASGFEAGRQVVVVTGDPIAPTTVLACGLELELTHLMSMGTFTTDESGAVVLGGPVPATMAGARLHVQALAPSACQATARGVVTFAAPGQVEVGGRIPR